MHRGYSAAASLPLSCHPPSGRQGAEIVGDWRRRARSRGAASGEIFGSWHGFPDQSPVSPTRGESDLDIPLTLTGRAARCQALMPPITLATFWWPWWASRLAITEER